MADGKPPPEFRTALVTEHFVLQSAASSTISESGSRVALYLSALTSGLVAIGYASSSPHALAALAFTVLPTVFALGWFTIVRLIDTSVANVVSLRRMELIRRYYASIVPTAKPYFQPDDPVSGTQGGCATAAGLSCSPWPARSSWSTRSSAVPRWPSF
jgi:hypothetical protein